MQDEEPLPKPVFWVGSSRDDVRAFPEAVRLRVGGALWEAQLGRKATWANFDGDTFRAVYTVRFASAVYVLHAFQKKAKHGIATPRHQIGLIDQRLKRAKEAHEQWLTAKST